MDAFVHVHETVRAECVRLATLQGRNMVITPRHYLDFIQHYVRLLNEKRSDLEDQQLHVNVGMLFVHSFFLNNEVSRSF